MTTPNMMPSGKCDGYCIHNFPFDDTTHDCDETDDLETALRVIGAARRKLAVDAGVVKPCPVCQVTDGEHLDRYVRTPQEVD